jgi:hypothetical protein
MLQWRWCYCGNMRGMATAFSNERGITFMSLPNGVSRPFQRQRFGWYRRGHRREPLSSTLQAECSVITLVAGNCSTRAASTCATSCEADVDPELRISRTVRRWYTGRWIRCRGLIAWAPRSPNLNPIEFLFICKHLRQNDYAIPRRSIDNLAANLQATVVTVGWQR